MTLLLIVLVVLGLAFVFVEFFIPGGVVGIIGGMLIVAAIIMGYINEGPVVGSILLTAALVLGAILIPLWMKLFPNTPIGRSMTLAKNLPTGNGDTTPGLQEGTVGVSVTPLRPSGTARFGAERVDVVSEGRMIEAGEKVEVVLVEGSRVVVRIVFQ